MNANATDIATDTDTATVNLTNTTLPTTTALHLARQKQSWQMMGYQALRVLLAGGLWVAGLFVVPLLFQVLDRAQAVYAATAVFRGVGVLGFLLLAGLCLLHARVGASRVAKAALWGALMAGSVLQFWVVPMLIADAKALEKEPLWHILANVLFISQMVCAAIVALGHCLTPFTPFARSQALQSVPTEAVIHPEA